MTGGDLDDFVENVVADGDDYLHIGAKLIEYFCLDGTRAFCGVPGTVLFAVKFLENCSSTSCDAGPFLKDLKDLFGNCPSHEQILDLVKSHFG